MWRWFLACVLAVSLVANVVLLTRDAPTPPVASLKTAGRPARAVLSIPTRFSSLDDAALERRVARVETQIEIHLPIAERFTHGVEDREVTATVRAFLERALGTEPAAFRFECRGRVCRVGSENPDFTDLIQKTYPGRELFRQMAFGPDGVFVELGDREFMNGAFARGILFAAYDSPAFKHCPTDAKGTITIDLHFDRTSRHFVVSIGGTLAHDPIGTCMADVLRAAAAKASVPDDLNPKDDTRTIELPSL